MPLDSMLVVAVVVLMFGAFAAALAWADSQTRPTAATESAKSKRRAF